MTPTKKIIIAIVALVVLGLVVWLLFFRGKQTETPIVEPGGDTGEITDAGTGTVVVPGDVEPGSIARAFVERFGSFSSEADYQNVEDVMALSTVKLQGELQIIAEEARAKESGAYYGVSTRIVVIDEEEKTDTSATLRITTQREESIGSPENTSVRMQEIIVRLVKNGRSWLVDNFEWQE